MTNIGTSWSRGFELHIPLCDPAALQTAENPAENIHLKHQPSFWRYPLFLFFFSDQALVDMFSEASFFLSSTLLLWQMINVTHLDKALLYDASQHIMELLIYLSN